MFFFSRLLCLSWKNWGKNGKKILKCYKNTWKGVHQCLGGAPRCWLTPKCWLTLRKNIIFLISSKNVTNWTNSPQDRQVFGCQPVSPLAGQNHRSKYTRYKNTRKRINLPVLPFHLWSLLQLILFRCNMMSPIKDNKAWQIGCDKIVEKKFGDCTSCLLHKITYTFDVSLRY